MSLQEIQEWIKANLAAKQKEFGVPHFRINVEYSERMEDYVMQITPDIDYERASITIFFAYYADKSLSVFESDMEHELLHIAHSPFDDVKSHVLNRFCKDEADVAWFNQMFSSACERTVRNMERTVYGIRHCAPALQPKEEN